MSINFIYLINQHYFIISISPILIPSTQFSFNPINFLFPLFSSQVNYFNFSSILLIPHSYHQSPFSYSLDHRHPIDYFDQTFSYAFLMIPIQYPFQNYQPPIFKSLSPIKIQPHFYPLIFFSSLNPNHQFNLYQSYQIYLLYENHTRIFTIPSPILIYSYLLL